MLVGLARRVRGGAEIELDLLESESARVVGAHKAADVAAAVNLSDSRFRYLFRMTYGFSPHQYLVDVRISAAKQMLWDTDIPIVTIAEQCGFGCQQYFNDIFKRETGTSPGRYRSAFSRKYEL